MTLRFLALMLIGSGLGFLKVIGAAALLPTDSFGNYVTVIGFAALSSLLLSFGKVEATSKQFPRLWVENTYGTAWASARNIVRVLVLRCAGLGLLAFGLAFVVPHIAPSFGITPADVIIASWLCLTMLTSAMTLITSLIRGVGDVRLIQNFIMMRGAVIFLPVIIVAMWGNWQTVLLAEITATAVVLVSGYIMAKRASGGMKLSGQAPSITLDRDGRTLFYANSCSASITMGDKAFVNVAMGATLAGIYGTIGLATQMGQLLSGIMSQKVGPDIIKAIKRDDGLEQAFRQIRFPACVIALAAFGLIAFVFASKSVFPVVADFLDGRMISNTAIGLAGIALFLQIYLLIEFVVLAYDREEVLLKCSACAAIVCYTSMTAAWLTQAPVEAFVLSVIAGRSVHLILLWGVIRTIIPPADGEQDMTQ